jgi:hypothetical protein
MGITKENILTKIIDYLKKYKILNVRLFGSFARNEENNNSDIDLIVNFQERKSLFELARIERELSEQIGIKVDLLTEKSISPYLIDKIKSEEKILYVK